MRRRALLRKGAAIAIVGIAGCAGDTDEPTATPRTTEPVETTTVATTVADTETPTPTASPTATSTDAPEPTGSPTETATPTPTPTPTATPGAEADQVVAVAPDGSFSFDPESFTIGAGESVAWRWEAGGHNVRPESVPEGADWAGTPGGDGDTYDEGYTYTHTFEVAGEYEYYCGPHRSAGMTGSFTVE